MSAIDTHVHLWDPAARSYPWLATPGLELLNRAYSNSDYTAASVGTGLDGGVFVECDPAPGDALDEARFALALAARPESGLLGVVAHVSPASATFAADLAALLALPGADRGLKGVRRVLHTQADDLSRSPLFRENVRALGRAGLSFDLCVLARQLPAARELAAACPEVGFILDHCGVPDVKGRALDPWRDDLAALARLPNVACKISGLVAYAAPDWTEEDLRPFVEHSIACFGWDRVLFGGDWPVCLLGAPLARWHAALSSLLAPASADERDRLFRRNALRLYRLVPLPPALLPC
jgi:predicted TIM-barrel fold metal-dependent hydrolase